MNIIWSLLIVFLSVSLFAANRPKAGAPFFAVASVVAKQERALFAQRRLAKTDEEIERVNDELALLRFGKNQKPDYVGANANVIESEKHPAPVATAPVIWKAPQEGAAPATSSGGGAPGGGDEGAGVTTGGQPSRQNETERVFRGIIERALILAERAYYRPFLKGLEGYNRRLGETQEPLRSIICVSVSSQEPILSAEFPESQKPTRFDFWPAPESYGAEFERLVPVVAAVLERVIRAHAPLVRVNADDPFQRYTMAEPAPISISEYVKRIADHSFISPATLLGGLIILDRLTGRHPQLVFSGKNIYTFYLTAVYIASKIMELGNANNAQFAAVGGVSSKRLSELEELMLWELGFDCYISPAHIAEYIERATNGIPGQIPAPL